MRLYRPWVSGHGSSPRGGSISGRPPRTHLNPRSANTMRLWSPCRGWFPDTGWCLSQHLIRCDRARPACFPCCGEHAPARPQGCLIALCTRFRRDRPRFGVPIDDRQTGIWLSVAQSSERQARPTSIRPDLDLRLDAPRDAWFAWSRACKFGGPRFDRSSVASSRGFIPGELALSVMAGPTVFKRRRSRPPASLP